LNPAVLRWARERAGLTPEDVAAAMSKDVAVILAWEAGQAAPTFRQLETLATRTYRRPVAVFFFADVPEEEDLATEFRTLPSSESAAFEPDTRFALREARAHQLALSELTAGVERSEPIITAAIRASVDTPPAELAQQVTAYFGISLDQRQRWRSAEDGLKAWRSAVEDAGVYVFKRRFTQREVSGFCLDDPRFPVIVINNGTSHSRQIFTLFHELGHLLYGLSGVTTEQQDYLGSLAPSARALEVACNQFAAEFLVPDQGFPWHRFEGRGLDEAVPEVADLYRVSRHVILRRLLDHRRITQATYEAKVAEWEDDLYRHYGGTTGGSYYSNQGVYLSEGFVSLAFHQFHAGRIALSDLADYLGMKAKNVGKFEEHVLRGGS